MADDTSKTSAPNPGDSQGNNETLTPAQLKAGVKLKAQPDPVTITVVGVSGKPR